MGSNKDMMELLVIEEAGNHPRAHPGHVWLWIGFFVIGWSILLLTLASFVIFLLIVPVFTGVLSVYVTSLLRVAVAPSDTRRYVLVYRTGSPSHGGPGACNCL